MVGSTVTPIVTVTLAEPDLVASAIAVAVTVMLGGEGGTAGAVYSPVRSMVPNTALPPGMLLTCQVTALFAVP